MNVTARITGWTSGALTERELKQVYADGKSLFNEQQRVRRMAGRAGWVIGGVGTVIGLSGMICAASLFPLKTTEVKFVVVDQTSGYVGEAVGVKDAPSLFNEATTHYWLRTYVEAREGYLPETDQLMFRRAAIMSSPDEQARYAAWHKSPTAPAASLRASGYVRVQNFQIDRLGSGKGKTEVYTVRFDREEIRGNQIGPKETWSATVQFQWHPELQMTREDRQLNPAGLQVMSYQVRDPKGTR